MTYEIPALLPCPRCDRLPRLREVGFVQSRSYSEPSRRIYLVSCRKWLGLRLCFGSHNETWIASDWADLGQRTASERWNAEVMRHRGDQMIRHRSSTP